MKSPLKKNSFQYPSEIEEDKEAANAKQTGMTFLQGNIFKHTLKKVISIGRDT